MTGSALSPPALARRFPQLQSPTLHNPRSDFSGPLPALRAATRLHHEHIDALMDLPRLHASGRYGAVLQAFDAFLAGWEPAVEAVLPQRRAWLRARSRRPFLQQDLRWLGLPNPRAAPPPPLRSQACAWGSLYVIEGSALGGQVIVRSLAAAGLQPGAGAAYFQGWGDTTGGMWREFRLLLDAQLAEAAAVAQACEAAQLTFQTLSLLLETALHERTPAA
jgi:heme oxygenase